MKNKRILKKVFILTIQFLRHVDPVIQIGKELTNERKVKTVIYSKISAEYDIQKNAADIIEGYLI